MSAARRAWLAAELAKIEAETAGLTLPELYALAHRGLCGAIVGAQRDGRDAEVETLTRMLHMLEDVVGSGPS